MKSGTRKGSSAKSGTRTATGGTATFPEADWSRTPLILRPAGHPKTLASGKTLRDDTDPDVASEFARDSPLEEDGFELVVPLSKRTAVPSSPFGFPVDGTGYGRSDLRKRRFRVPGRQGNLARRGTCVVLNGCCIEACVGGVTGWAIDAGGDPRETD